jgi:branched-subunit amino acid aminotransferase/4-amino-4-deoxychorismate lyase
MNSYFNGKYIPLDEVKISPLDFGFIHGHATYDVMRGLTFFERHYKRFKASCKYYGFIAPNKDELLKIIQNLLDKDSDMFIWLIMWKGAPPSGSPRDLSGPDHFLVYTKPYYPISLKPIKIKIVDELPRSPGYQEYKNFSWIELTKAQQLSEDFDTALVRNIEGYINEGPGFGVCFAKKTNIGWVVFTPKTDVLNSITIQIVEEICENLGIQFIRSDFKNIDFDECFICSTSGGLTEVEQINETRFNSFELTKKLKKEYARLSR